MEKKINIVELLKDCPMGMELDCTVYDNCILEEILEKNLYPVKIKTPEGSMLLTKYGCFSLSAHAKCTIFPKGKTTWEGFHRQFNDGDIIFTHANCLKVGLGNTWISIYQENRNGGVATYVDCAEDGNDYYSNIDEDKPLLCMEKDIMRQRFATEEEKQKLFQAIKANGYKWNAEAKTLEKLVEPKFKVGDRIKYKNGKDIHGVEQGVILSITDGTYDVAVTNNKGIFVPITDQDKWELIELKFKVGDRIRNKNYKGYIYDIHDIIDKGYRAKEINADSPILILFGSQEDNYELVPNKFDITTLKPFESRVLARDTNTKKWKSNFWGFYDIDNTMGYPYNCCGNSFAQCIPYEGNEHLLGKTDDCNDYYKTWE